MWLSLNQKNGTRNWKQRWKCLSCGYILESKKWIRTKIIDGNKLSEEFMLYNDTYRLLSYRYKVSTKTIQRKLDGVQNTPSLSIPGKVIIMMDTTYFGRKYGYMVFRDYLGEKNILRYKVSRETNTQYKEWIRFLQEQWWIILAIVCDGKIGLLWWFGHIPVQMCHFHQKQIIVRYLTRKPKLEPNVELKDIASSLGELPESTMFELLQDRHRRYKDWLWEKNYSNWYAHIRTRKAYRSLIKNLPYLYTYKKHPELCLPTTTNQLEWWVFSWMKQRLWNHRWLALHRKQKRIERYLNWS